MNTILDFIKNHKLLTFMVLLLLIVGIPLTLFQVNKSQETRSKASGGSVAVLLIPLTSTLSTGSNLDIQVVLNGGDSDISATDITFTYDMNLLALNPGQTTPFQPATTFTAITNRVTTPGTVHFVGVNPTSNPISGATIPLGTLHFTTQAPGAASVGFSNIHINGAGVASALPVDAENTKIGTYTITQGGNPPISPIINCGANTPCPTGYTCNLQSQTTTDTGVCTLTTVSISPTGSTLPNPTAIVTPVTTPQAGANISLSLKLPGIGSELGGNNAPKTPARTVTVALFDSTGQQVKSVNGSVVYANGVFSGLVPMGTLTAGPYEAKVRLDNTLWKRLPGILTVSSGTQVFAAPTLNLVPGDLSAKNLIDLSDYNTVLACYSGTCSATIKPLADLNDDGIIDTKDLNILLRSFAQHQGD